jgi:MEMO1 family protein
MEAIMFRIQYNSLIILSIFLLTNINIHGEDHPLDNKAGIKTRPASVAGAFYPDDGAALLKEINNLLDNASRVETSGKVIAALAPHAGYIYSGQIAALTFKNISDIDFDTIVIIGHDSYRDAVAYTCPVDFFETPLGKIPVDTEMMEKLHSFSKNIKPDISIHSEDHTIEVQLPFIQAMNKKCKILPLMFGFPSPENCKILADAIKKAAGDKKIFILASTDMSHYPDYDGAYKMDNLTLDKIKSMDLNLFFRHVYKQMKEPGVPNLQTPICASGGVGTAMLYAQGLGADAVQVLKYANSGDVTEGDKNRVVGYSSLLFIKK